MHPDTFLASLPPELQATAMPLSTDGTIAGAAWSAPDFVRVASEIRRNSLAILGGDVVVVNKQGLRRYSYDNWSSNHDSNEAYDDFVSRSVRETLRYVEHYPDPVDGTITYAPTVTDAKGLMGLDAVIWAQVGAATPPKIENIAPPSLATPPMNIRARLARGLPQTARTRTIQHRP